MKEFHGLPRLRARFLVLLVGTVAALSLGAAPAFAASDPSPGDDPITITINDSESGATYDLEFELAYSGTTTADLPGYPGGTPVYIYVPTGALGENGTSVPGMNPQFDPDPNDAFTPCAQRLPSSYKITQAQIDQLGAQLTGQIVKVDEAHFGPMDAADPNDPNSDALVVLVYNVNDDFYYDCAATSYTAGYFAPDFISTTGMNVIVVDSYDWANRVGSPRFLYEGVIAHELEHLLMNYSDPGELSWVDEGLADMAAFLNGYPVLGALGSHVANEIVFHRDTSLTRWGGTLANYGASFTYFLYLWEQAGGNGDGTYAPDKEYDGAGGDLLIKLLFEEQADSLEGVQNAIDTFNAMGHPGVSAPLRSATELFEDWAVALYVDGPGPDPANSRFQFRNLDFGDAATTTRWTVDLANDVFWGGRGIYNGAMPNSRWENNKNVPLQLSVPFGTSYETFRNPGPTFSLFFDGADSTDILPHSAPTHWYGGYESQADNILNVDSPTGDLGGDTIDFWTWYFIEEGWDYGFVEACAPLPSGMTPAEAEAKTWATCPGGYWQPIELTSGGDSVTTDENPHLNNAEGNGLTGTSGGAYFVDEPTYINVTGTLPTGTTDVRFRYSTDAAYLDTGWFVDDVTIGGQAATLSSEAGNWTEISETQDNNWVVQIISPCDLTPGVTSEGEIVDSAGYVYRFEGDLIEQSGFNTRCLGGRDRLAISISNMPTGQLTVLDADYIFRIHNTGAPQAQGNK